MRRKANPKEVPVLVPVSVRRSLVLGVAVALLVAACGGTAAPTPAASAAPPSAGATASAPASTAAPVSLTVGLGYIPSVQFAQFYLAKQAGYYAAAGLDVTLQNKIDPDLITLLGQGAVDIGAGDGTSVIPAVSQGIPVVYTATVFGQYPCIVLAKAGGGITTAADLRGKKIGIPGKYGSSWFMLLALLGSVGLKPADVTIVEFPSFGQATALQQGVVDAATGFANNEPIQLRNAGIEPVVLTIDAITPLPGPGLVTGTKTLAAKHDALKAFIAATLRAEAEIKADPQKGLDATFALVPDLKSNAALQRQILDATIAIWPSPRTGGVLGALDTAGWQLSLDFMTTLGLVPNAVTTAQLLDGSLLP